MEQFIRDIEAYASAKRRSPQAILRDAIKANWGTWDGWCAGRSSPTMAVADRVRAYMAANPAPPPVSEDAA
ncbi:hypothetical protein ACEN2S_16670 [Phaeovulum sp. W22_SRMD_FR3]